MQTTTVTNDLTALTQNCFFSKTLKKVIKLVNETRCDVYCLQEISGVKTAEKIKLETGLNYTISNGNRALLRIFNHNAVFTNLPIIDSGEFTFTKSVGKKGVFAGKVLWVVVEKLGRRYKFYNCHLGLRKLGMDERAQILDTILKDASGFDGPVVVCGDMNTIIPDKKDKRRLVQFLHKFPSPKKEKLAHYADKNEKHVFKDAAEKNGFHEVADLDVNTWVFPFTKKELFNLKLDWFLVKGFAKVDHLIGEAIGDHKSILCRLSAVN